MKCGRWPPLGVCSQHLPGCDQPLFGKRTKGIGSGETWGWEPIRPSLKGESNSPVEAVSVEEEEQHPEVPAAPLPVPLPSGSPAHPGTRLACVARCPCASEPAGSRGSARPQLGRAALRGQPWGSRSVCTVPGQALKAMLTFLRVLGPVLGLCVHCAWLSLRWDPAMGCGQGEPGPGLAELGFGSD